jgi:hypothetical protein
MLNKRQNFLETIKVDGHPDRLVKQYEGNKPCMRNPVFSQERGSRPVRPGDPDGQDVFGTWVMFPVGQVAAFPHVTESNKVVPDVCDWKKFVKFPKLENYIDNKLWEDAIAAVEAVDRKEQLVMAAATTGVFERLHFLMGFEDTLMNFLLEPEAMKDLCAAVGEYRCTYMKMIADYIKPDVMLSHDDWGSKNSLFMSPDVWREFIKPQYAPAYGYLKEKGIIIMHHADSFMEPIVEDMVELGIDIWQGVLPSNDIVSLQKKLAGRMTLMGGIDAGVVDRADSTEEEIRAEVRRACDTYAPGGHFIPCITYGLAGCLYKHVDPIIDDEIDRYNTEHCGISE